MKGLNIVTVIGAGLAGSEAAWQAANRGAEVTLVEMRPCQNTPAHHTDQFAELVCSNSLRAGGLENAVGLLKEEMRQLNSIIMQCADEHKVPAGGALAVDREGFSRTVTDRVSSHPRIRVVREEARAIPAQGVVVIASGPLTSDHLAATIQQITGQEYLYFYDAAAPIVTLESLDMNKVFRASRYNKGDADYLNCPMNEAEYNHFWEELVAAEKAPVKEFEKHFEGCMPVEAMAKRGRQTLLFGPLKPVGLDDPRTGRWPHAVVQLRQDNSAATLYNLVGFQTNLKWPEQRRVFSLIPGLEQAEFVRYGVMHRNTFINSPQLLDSSYRLRKEPRLLFAGQITGVEGYIESAASGLVAGLNAARQAAALEPLVFPPETALGAHAQYISTTDAKHFQPMNITFGLLPPLPERIRDKKLRNRTISERALASLEDFKARHGL
ncbi:MAG TPA: methylenetetrahydrofolate--tRNA-(uracil(54)-C(5))-methyltransferase (FADH(2)-oxidizing) TrmFO [Bacillota bacterium]|nr:methylenetetrahydrofolate--tRNA-(uracil(54)-C(5))-methyltransferase (FADH(2)-oxidizing) TrmFO [Bacillota bacterium]